MTVSGDTPDRVLMTAHEYATEWFTHLGIEPGFEVMQAAVASIEALIRRNGSVSRDEIYRAAHAATLNWVETTITGPPSYPYEEVNW